MRPLKELPSETAHDLKGVFADIDDTITTNGYMTPDAYAALARLQATGLLVIPITGRPAGWCDHIARMWPVDGIVGENGAFYFRYDHENRKFTKRYHYSEMERAANRERMASVAEKVLASVPGADLASDQMYRETDLAIDYAEDTGPLGPEALDAIVALMTRGGMTAKISSIHVNGWFGSYDKLTMTRTMMDECFGIDLEAEKDRFVFVGDSPNDQPMFEYFPNTVGVANLKNFDDRLEHRPTFVTSHDSGSGFAELVGHIIRARSH